MLKINMEFRKGILFVRLKGPLTRYTYRSLDDYLIPVINDHGIKYLVYNLEAVTLIDNYGKVSLKKGVDAARSNLGEGGICHAKTNFKDDFNIFENELVALTKLQI